MAWELPETEQEQYEDDQAAFEMTRKLLDDWRDKHGTVVEWVEIRPSGQRKLPKFLVRFRAPHGVQDSVYEFSWDDMRALGLGYLVATCRYGDGFPEVPAYEGPSIAEQEGLRPATILPREEGRANWQRTREGMRAARQEG